MLTFGVPMMVLGGGGYNITNVARCWAYETGRILGTPSQPLIRALETLFWALLLLWRAERLCCRML